MLESSRWSRAWSAVLLVTASGVCLSSAEPAYGQVRAVPIPAGPLGPGPVAPWHPEQPPWHPEQPPWHPDLVPLGHPAGSPSTAMPTDAQRTVADPRTQRAVPRDGKPQRTMERERRGVASAVRTIGQQNRERAAIVLKIRRVTP
jgi:hypothetical protein